MRRPSSTPSSRSGPPAGDWGEECTEILKVEFAADGQVRGTPAPTVLIRAQPDARPSGPALAASVRPEPVKTPTSPVRPRTLRRTALRQLSMLATAGALTAVYFAVPVDALSFEAFPSTAPRAVPPEPPEYQVKVTPAVVVAPALVVKPSPPAPPAVPPHSGGAGRVRWAKGEAQDRALVWPVDNAIITSRFGARVDPVDGSADGMHRGVDVGCTNGTPVMAAASGKVVLARRTSTGGLTIRLEHEDKRLYTLYAHLSKLSVKVGDEVQAGQVIGKSGQTGRVTGPHLHFEVWTRRRALNPLGLRYRPAATPVETPTQPNPAMLAVAAPAKR